MDNDKLIRKPFTTKRLQEERTKDTVIKITIKFNSAEQERLKNIKSWLQQSKDGTAIKQALIICSKVGLPEFIDTICHIKNENYRKNLKNGISNFD